MDLFAQSYFLDRRSELRQRVVNFVLKLDPGDGRAPITCAVWDISEGGTRLKLAQDVELPQIVDILIGNVRKPARVVWRKADHVGLQYLAITARR
jgi:hypothetical protein